MTWSVAFVEETALILEAWTSLSKACKPVSFDQVYYFSVVHQSNKEHHTFLPHIKKEGRNFDTSALLREDSFWFGSEVDLDLKEETKIVKNIFWKNISIYACEQPNKKILFTDSIEKLAKNRI